MRLDAGELVEFYESPTGRAARRLIARRILDIWPHLRGCRVLGYGFAVPYLKHYLPEVERAIAMMPARMGVVAWPSQRQLALLGEEDALPFADALFDRILVVHGLEGADAARVLLRQLWRVLAPEGRILLVAPNRASLWAQMEASPFACGRPFHRGELGTLLCDTLFEPVRWERALYMPPFSGRRLSGIGTGLERLGHRFLTGLSGVHLVEASKSLYGTAPALKAHRRKDVALRPAHTLQG
ncbi:MAG TPA: methyltransferase domain-containing protein [Rhizomicrobium sp.]|nr:methyltransferase domain-containing protein [Rhizomicrobium sp.]